MMRHLPAVKAVLTDAEQMSLAQMPPPPGISSAFGCSYQYIHYALDENCDASSYRVHPFHEIAVKGEQTVHIKPEEQFEKIASLLPNRIIQRPTCLIVINAFGHLDEGFSLMWHLAGSIANLRHKMRDQTIMFSYLADAWLQNPEDGWLMKARHVVAWGPLVEDNREFAYEKAASFLTNFHFLPRILLLAVSDVGACLRRLNITPERVDYLFNVRPAFNVVTATKRPYKKKAAPKEKPRSVSV